MIDQQQVPTQFHQANRRFSHAVLHTHWSRVSARRPLAALARAFLMTLVATMVAPASAATTPSGFKICDNQTYALCATAKCTVLNNVSYCKCDVKSGDSISLPFNYSGGDVCSINAQGPGNGFMLSTFSVPASALPGGNTAIYTCPAKTSDGAYAQCDGGTCFASTRGHTFFGFPMPLKISEIICSCPITVADPSSAFIGHQIAGPYPCQSTFFSNCQAAPAHTRTGGTIYVGAPTGSVTILAKELTGTTLNFNQCPPGHPQN